VKQIREIDDLLKNLAKRYPSLSSSLADIDKAFRLLRDCYENKNKVLVCGSGGSASDSEHIVGELMKSFAFTRTLSDEVKNRLFAVSADHGAYLAEKLQPALRAISLTCHN
jgi:D-sedoheptulose 7-phosphate isomerase